MALGRPSDESGAKREPELDCGSGSAAAAPGRGVRRRDGRQERCAAVLPTAAGRIDDPPRKPGKPPVVDPRMQRRDDREVVVVGVGGVDRDDDLVADADRGDTWVIHVDDRAARPEPLDDLDRRRLADVAYARLVCNPDK